ncbi:hypothetical protein Dimus_007514 [Dionaea muscipula]
MGPFTVRKLDRFYWLPAWVTGSEGRSAATPSTARGVFTGRDPMPLPAVQTGVAAARHHCADADEAGRKREGAAGRAEHLLAVQGHWPHAVPAGCEGSLPGCVRCLLAAGPRLHAARLSPLHAWSSCMAMHAWPGGGGGSALSPRVVVREIRCQYTSCVRMFAAGPSSVHMSRHPSSTWRSSNVVGGCKSCKIILVELQVYLKYEL